MVWSNNNDTNKNKGPNGATTLDTPSLAGDGININGNDNKGVLLIISTVMDSIKTINS